MARAIWLCLFLSEVISSGKLDPVKIYCMIEFGLPYPSVATCMLIINCAKRLSAGIVATNVVTSAGILAISKREDKFFELEDPLEVQTKILKS
jgi:hypothetical protein